MENKKILESICAEFDYWNLKGREIRVKNILELCGIKNSDPNIGKYNLFVCEYSALTKDYQNEKNTLERQKNKDFSLGRIGLNSFIGVLLGSLFQPIPYMAATGAIAGCGLTTYSEAKDKDMNLSSVAFGVFIGGIIGALCDPQDSNIFSYIGASVGGSLGFIKEKINNRGKSRSIEQLDVLYNNKKNTLINSTLETIN